MAIVTQEQVETLGDNMAELIKQIDPNKKEYYITDVSVITLDDNLQHNYFSSMRWSKYNQDPMSEAMMIMPYDDNIAMYWEKYAGTVIVSGKLSTQTVNTNSIDFFTNTVQVQHKKAIEKSKILMKKKQEEMTEDEKKLESKKTEKELKQRLINDNYNYSYVGKVSRFKQKGQKFIIYLEDLGWKFSQKVPKEFRDTFVANQSLDDVFQAICEFMGIEFAYSIEDLNEYTFAGDGYSIQKDGETIEDVPSILKEWAPEVEGENEEEPDDTEDFTTDDNKSTTKNTKNKKNKKNKKKSKSKTSKSTNSNDSSIASSSINKNFKTQSNTRNVTMKDFDENKKNNDAIEDDKEGEEKDTQSVEEKIEKYQEEFDEKVKDLFIGNTYYDSNVSDPILNYDWITITPKAPPSDASAAGNALGTAANGINNTNNANGGNNYGNASATSSLQARDRNGWHNGQLYENGKIVLYNSYINSLPPHQAAAKARQTGTYTSDTLRRLRIRAQGVRVY